MTNPPRPGQGLRPDKPAVARDSPDLTQRPRRRLGRGRMSTPTRYECLAVVCGVGWVVFDDVFLAIGFWSCLLAALIYRRTTS